MISSRVIANCIVPGIRKACPQLQSLKVNQVKQSTFVFQQQRKMSRLLASEVNATENGGAQYDYDLLVIGAGSGGVRASRISSGFGAKTAVIELPFGFVSSDAVGGAGGTCVIRGCVPKKLFVYGSEYAEHFKDAEGFGWSSTVNGHEWDKLITSKGAEIERLNSVYGRILGNAGVEVIEGRGVLKDAHSVEVTGVEGDKKVLTSKYILIATGSKAQMLGFVEGIEHAISSDHALVLPQKPKKIAIYGAGYIANEFACIFHGYGIETHVFFRKPAILKEFDKECTQLVMDTMIEHGVHMHPETTPVKIEKMGEAEHRFHYKTKDGTVETLDCDYVMMATGRTPNTQNLNLEAVGVTVGKDGSIPVDKHLKTSVPSVYALGDAINRMQLTPVALGEGMSFARRLFGNMPDAFPDYNFVASAIFTQPQMGTVGLSEEQAIAELSGDLDIYTASFKAMRNTISGSTDKTLMKLVVHKDTDIVVGAHMVGHEAGEIMQGLAVALKAGATKAMFDSTIGIHPTSAEEFVTMRSVTRTVQGKGSKTPKEFDAGDKYLNWSKGLGVGV